MKQRALSLAHPLFHEKIIGLYAGGSDKLIINGQAAPGLITIPEVFANLDIGHFVIGFYNAFRHDALTLNPLKIVAIQNDKPKRIGILAKGHVKGIASPICFPDLARLFISSADASGATPRT